jgi:hypothetical protein
MNAMTMSRVPGLGLGPAMNPVSQDSHGAVLRADWMIESGDRETDRTGRAPIRFQLLRRGSRLARAVALPRVRIGA